MSPPVRPQPHPRLLEKLLPAYSPCLGFTSTCRCMVWRPAEGHVPRGFYGATGELEEVELVLVCASPSGAYPDERYSGSPEDMLRSAWQRHYEDLRVYRDRFSRNIRHILDNCFPEQSLDDQMRRTWITNSVLCSPERPAQRAPVAVMRECHDRYLLQQVGLLPNALVVALGKQAAESLRGTQGLLEVVAAVPIGISTEAAWASWNTICERLRERRDGR
jgi:hypothetical protein